jgi:hypothetical protein
MDKEKDSFCSPEALERILFKMLRSLRCEYKWKYSYKFKALKVSVCVCVCVCLCVARAHAKLN